MNDDNAQRPGDRRFTDDGHVIEIVAVAVPPMWVLYKDTQAWAVREMLPCGAVWYGGCEGGEPLDVTLADRAFREAR